jgi:hypothetical protein
MSGRTRLQLYMEERARKQQDEKAVNRNAV